MRRFRPDTVVTLSVVRFRDTTIANNAVSYAKMQDVSAALAPLVKVPADAEIVRFEK